MALACCCAANLPSADNRFLRTISAALVPPIHAFDGLLGLPGRTASQIELSSHTNCSAKQGLVLDTDF